MQTERSTQTRGTGITFSIITPSFNQADYIEENLRSVREQPYRAVEHIVIDGGSTDGTVAILRRSSGIAWCSEPDRGQADALNKGLAQATGDIVGWINSDDWYAPDSFAEVAAAFADPGVQWVVGNVTSHYGVDGTSIVDKSPTITRAALLRDPHIVRQQATFFRRELLLRAGGWDASLWYVMDYDLWLRLCGIAAPQMADRNWATFRIHADQKTSSASLLRQLRELQTVMMRSGATRRDVRRVTTERWFDIGKAAVKGALISSRLLPERYRTRPLRNGWRRTRAAP